MLARCHRRHHPAKGTIIYIGDAADVLYCTIAGSIAVIFEDRKEDRELTLTYLNPGDFIANIDLFQDAPSSSWLRARADCEIAEITTSTFTNQR